ncbi:hypothetical protein ACIQOW_38365 [Kitasatospora sp. NPDC091335]|uniref:hypothetical protein n=1 Tax=Kitasatospora sp. NPDC091335 TaxID=3364085 RepID=UPI00382B4B5D
MSGTVDPSDQGRWRAQRARGTRGPNRGLRQPLMPPPDEVVVDEEAEETETPRQ